jgi:hypothetical protein
MDYAVKILELEIYRIRQAERIIRKQQTGEENKQVEELQLAIEILRKWEEYQDKKAIKG